MITIKDFMETTLYRISEGSSYGWECYGPHAQNLDYWESDFEGGGFSVSIVYDSDTQEVFEMQAWDTANEREYRYLNPDFSAAHNAEAISRGLDPSECIDGRKFIDLETEDDILDKAASIVLGLEYDTRIVMSLNLPKEELNELMLMAHEQDITFNQLVNNILEKAIAETGPERVWP